MVDPPPRTDIRARLEALPDAIPPGTRAEDDDPTGYVLVYVVGIVLVMAIRSFLS